MVLQLIEGDILPYCVAFEERWSAIENIFTSDDCIL